MNIPATIKPRPQCLKRASCGIVNPNTAMRLKISSAVWRLATQAEDQARANLWIGKTERNLAKPAKRNQHGNKRKALTPAAITACAPAIFYWVKILLHHPRRRISILI